MAGRKLKATAKTNLQNWTHKTRGKNWRVEQQSSVAGNSLQENLLKSFSCRFCLADVTLLEKVSVRSGLGWRSIVSWRNVNPHLLGLLKLENEKLNENYLVLTNLVAWAAEIRSCKGYFRPGTTFEPALSLIWALLLLKQNNPSLGPDILCNHLITPEERPKVYFSSYLETKISASEVHILSLFPTFFSEIWSECCPIIRPKKTVSGNF